MNKAFFTSLSLSIFALPALAEGEVRAVLVGVGDYLYLDADLKGPVHDVGLMARTLMKRGVKAEDIRVLADAEADLPDGAQRGAPDRKEILQVFEQAIVDSNAGDTVFFYFSGHGAQAPDQDGDEGGGLDEIFLPRDAKGWNSAIGEVENAIRDDTFGRFAHLAAERGVKLVAVLDACHSGTGFRALGTQKGQARFITSDTLGLPDEIDTRAQPQSASAAPTGEFVYLYAAQSDQRAFEYPVGEGEAQRWHGDFTRALTSVLQEEPVLSWSTLVALATDRMAARSGQAVQTPDIEGTLSDAAVPGSDAPGLRRITVNGTTLDSGVLGDVTAGSTYDLFASLTAKDPVGQAVVEAVTAQDATLRYLEPLPVVKVTHAELLKRAPDVSLSVALSEAAAAHLEKLQSGAVDLLRESLDFPLAPVGTAADYTLDLSEGRFVWVGANGILDADGAGTSPRFDIEDPDPIAIVARVLTANVARARLDRALLQIGSGGSALSFSLIATGPSVSFSVKPGRVAGRKCRAAQTVPIAVEGKVSAHHCDELHVEIQNPTSKMQDVTVLYSDPENGISMIWPPSNLSNRLESGAQKTLRFGLRNPDETKILSESLIVLSTPAAPGSTRTVFANLQTGGTMRGTASPMAGYLAGLTAPDEASRSLSLAPDDDTLQVDRIDLLISSADAD